MRSAVLATACAVMVASGAFAQPRAGNETIEVRLVEVPVNVIDANGEPIRGLTAANFELYDENQKQQITNFDVTDLRSGAARSSAPTSSSTGRRNFLLLFDVTNFSPVSLTRARDAATQFVAQQVAATDRVAVATLSAHRGFRLLTSFTTDRVLVGTAITTLGAPKYFSREIRSSSRQVTSLPRRVKAARMRLQRRRTRSTSAS